MALDIISSPRIEPPPPDWSSIVLIKSAGLVLKSNSPVEACVTDDDIDVDEVDATKLGRDVQLAVFCIDDILFIFARKGHCFGSPLLLDVDDDFLQNDTNRFLFGGVEDGCCCC